MLKHVVLMKFKSGTKYADVEELVNRLEKLPPVIPEIKQYEFGRDIVRSERSYDFSLVSAFEDMAAMKRYQVHDDHRKVLAQVKAICESVIAVDFEY